MTMLSDSRSNQRHVLLAFATLIGFAAAVAPTLSWQEFSSGPENLALATALEIRRGDCGWLMPTLQGEPRLAKPPLTAWITALAIRGDTLRNLSSTDAPLRERAYRELAFQIRLSSVLTTCLLLLGLFELARAVRDAQLGAIAVGVCATSYMMLRFGRYVTTDLDLATCVVWANAFLAQAILRGRRWRGCIGAGVALGVSMLCKGPVGLVQSVVPVIVYAIIERRRARPARDPVGVTQVSPATGETSLAPTDPVVVGPVIVGTILMLLIGLSWYAYAFATVPGAWHRWWTELSRSDIPKSAIGPRYLYLALFGYVLPWTVMFVVGIAVIIRQWRRREPSPAPLPLLLTFIPLLVMTFFGDREHRYALPVLPAAALVAAIGVAEHLRSARTWTRADTLIAIAHWSTMALILIGLPTLGATHVLTKTDGAPWYTPSTAAVAAMVGAALVVACVFASKTKPATVIVGTVIAMLAVQSLAFRGYVESAQGRSVMKPLADDLVARYPSALTFNGTPNDRRPPTDLGVYLNRIVRWQPDPARIEPTARPQVLFMLREKSNPPPTPPPGWQHFADATRGKEHWQAFVRRAAWAP
jgi:4-amino-4-deoxy-L-arabinose transferase-like glycosyltransferase